MSFFEGIFGRGYQNPEDWEDEEKEENETSNSFMDGCVSFLIVIAVIILLIGVWLSL